MIAVIQRSREASVEIDNKTVGAIEFGLVILLGIEEADDPADAAWLARKIVQLRIFEDSKGVMNWSALDVKAEMLVISQFTLHASTKKGNRPSYIKAAKPDKAVPLYELFLRNIEQETGAPVQAGEFGAHMNVRLINDGPVTIIIDTRDKK